MSGKGERFNSQTPKQFADVNGHPLFYCLLDQYRQAGFIDGYFLVTNPEWIDYVKTVSFQLLGNKVLGVIPGGDTMSKSIYNGIMYSRDYVSDEDILLIHDVTNPIVDIDKIPEVISVSKQYGFCVLGTEQVHTIYRIDQDNNIEAVIPRQEVSSGYSPEGFVFKNIYNCYTNANESELECMTSAIALAKAHGVTAKIVKSHIPNLKITYKEDLEIFKRITKEV